MTAETKKDSIGVRVERLNIAFVALMAFIIVFGLGVQWTTDSIREDAIKAGVARWTVNPETGKTKFEWITNAETSK